MVQRMIAKLKTLPGQLPPPGHRDKIDIAGQKESGLEPRFLQLRYRGIQLRQQRIVIRQNDRRLFMIGPLHRLRLRRSPRRILRKYLRRPPDQATQNDDRIFHISKNTTKWGPPGRRNYPIFALVNTELTERTPHLAALHDKYKDMTAGEG